MSWVTIENDGETFRFAAVHADGGVWVSHQGVSTFVSSEQTSAASETNDGDIRAPMTGKIVSVDVKVGDSLPAETVVLVLEAMKMEYRLKAPFAGSVSQVNCQPGDLVDLGKVLVSIDSESKDP